MHQLPFSRVYGHKLINAGLIESVLLSSPGRKKGIRLVDGNSLDRMVRLSQDPFAFDPNGRAAHSTALEQANRAFEREISKLPFQQPPPIDWSRLW